MRNQTFKNKRNEEKLHDQYDFRQIYGVDNINAGRTTSYQKGIDNSRGLYMISIPSVSSLYDSDEGKV